MKTIRDLFRTIFFIIMITLVSCSQSIKVKSPNGQIKVSISLNKNGEVYYKIKNGNAIVLENSKLGLRINCADFNDSLVLEQINKVASIADSYKILTGKKKNCIYRANELSFLVKNNRNQLLKVIFRVSDDGVAFCYDIPKICDSSVVIEKEYTSFHLFKDAHAWLHPHADARTGWNGTQPSYEENYYIDVPVGTPAPQKAGWSFPALFRSNNNWLLITETNVKANYCGSRLSAESKDGVYNLTFPQSLETTDEKLPVFPTNYLPVTTPWRVIIIGETLAPIVESTLVTDLADKSVTDEVDFVKPGQASWSWVLLKDDSTIFSVQKEFIDYASRMNWRYCLIDAYWDKQIGYDKIEELVKYANIKNVKIILWYNSAGSWNTAPLTPRNLMYDKEVRIKEFEKISKIGVAGIKVDFFGGDGQSMIAYYHEIFSDALKYKLLVNCHGATIPRGWNRTYPNLMTMEAVKGFEFVTFEQSNADKQPQHCTVLPFTRNAIGPMDFTPVAFSEVPNIQRKTSNAFELALSILFQSGIQHFAEVPYGMSKQPEYVKKFMSSIPEVWEDIKFIDGYPGKYIIIARKGNGKWYVAGINGQEKEQSVTFDLNTLCNSNGATIITDGENERSFVQNKIGNSSHTIHTIKIKPYGGFVATINESN